LHGSHWDTAMAFEDGERLFRSVREVGLEGVVAKKLSQRYRPGERLWVKVKNRGLLALPVRAGSCPKASQEPLYVRDSVATPEFRRHLHGGQAVCLTPLRR
jgi:ATP dependent DNA ligase domain